MKAINEQSSDCLFFYGKRKGIFINFTKIYNIQKTLLVLVTLRYDNVKR